MLGGKQEFDDGGEVVEYPAAFRFDLAVRIVVIILIEGIATREVTVERDRNPLIGPRWLRFNRGLVASEDRSVGLRCAQGVLVRAITR